MRNIFFKTEEDLTDLEGLSPKELVQIMKASSLDGADPVEKLDLDEARDFVSGEIESRSSRRSFNFQRYFWGVTAYAVAASIALIFFIKPDSNNYQVMEDEDFHAEMATAPAVDIFSPSGADKYSETTIYEWDSLFSDYTFNWDGGDSFKYATLSIECPDGTVIYKMRTSDSHLAINFEGTPSNVVLWTLELATDNDVPYTASGIINIVRK